MDLLQKIAPLFAGWNETLIWSVLQGHMGYAIADNEEVPTAAQLVLGDFCFLAGQPSVPFAAGAAARAGAAVRAGVEAVVILDGRRSHAMLVELFTEFGAGTLVKAS